MQDGDNVTMKDQCGNKSKPLLSAELYLIRVKANHNCWISNIEGDPGRTLLKENAQVYEDKKIADLVCYSLGLEYENRKFFVERF
jgi:hypothetical protein